MRWNTGPVPYSWSNNVAFLRMCIAGDSKLMSDESTDTLMLITSRSSDAHEGAIIKDHATWSPSVEVWRGTRMMPLTLRTTVAQPIEQEETGLTALPGQPGN